VVVLPLILPMAYAFGVDPYHLAIVFLLNLEIGYLTPPLGLNLFISGIRFGKSIGYVARSVLPFIGILVITLGVVTYVPIITTWAPDQMKVDGEVASLGGGFLAEGALDDIELDEEPDAGDHWDDFWGDDELDGGVDGGDAALGDDDEADDEVDDEADDAPGEE